MKKIAVLIFLVIPIFCNSQYSSCATSPAGTDVACGGKYSSYATSPDGKRVCAGGGQPGWLNEKLQ